MSKDQKLFLTHSSECTSDNRNEIIDNYINGTLSDQKRQEFEEHFFLCDICFRELQVRQEMAAVLKHEGTAVFGTVVEEKTANEHIWSLDSMVAAIKKYISVKWVPAGLAFAAVLILIVLGKGLLDSPNLEEQRTLFAANSTPSPFMESLLGLSQRAANVTEVSPPNGFNVRNDLLFSWKRDDTSELSIIILNNREEELLTFSTTGNEYLFENAADQLPPGLYYWKLEDEDEDKHVGKFFVNKPASLNPK